MALMLHRVIRISELDNKPAKSGRMPVSPATVWWWVCEGHFPKLFKFSDRVTIWNVSDVDPFTGL